MEILTENQAILAKGYQSTGVWCGIKRAKKDLALFFSEQSASVAGVFTTNAVKGAPVLVCQEHLAYGCGRAIVINSGNANTCTGPQGLADSRRMAQLAAEALGVCTQEIFPVSTGVIGVPLPMDKIARGISAAVDSLAAGQLGDAAEAILTTDLRPKVISVGFGPDKRYTLTGIAKGSGMIHPNMATMLAFLLTDAPIGSAPLQSLLKEVTDETFNMISVDGDTSTNDTVLAFANGAAGGEPILLDSEVYAQLRAAFLAACTYLAKEIARDGEGASKLITIEVRGARNRQEARLAARSISRSNLVKTAIYGADANWGRVLCAVGYSGIDLELEKVKMSIGGLEVFAGGVPLPFDETCAREVLSQAEVTITVDLGVGSAGATAYTCDFTEDYVKINASYRS